MSEHRRTGNFMIWLSLLLLGFPVSNDWPSAAHAEETTPTATKKSGSIEITEDRAGERKIAPDKFAEVDQLTSLTVITLAVFILGAVALLALIVVGARRIRRLTRSTALKTKYDELEQLRAKYRREMEGLETPPPPNREARR